MMDTHWRTGDGDEDDELNYAVVSANCEVRPMLQYSYYLERQIVGGSTIDQPKLNQCFH